jgi:hypothetical protein
MNNGTDKAIKVLRLLKMVGVEAGTTPAEALTAASIAAKIAREIGDGQLVARALVAQHKASVRAARAS